MYEKVHSPVQIDPKTLQEIEASEALNSDNPLGYLNDENWAITKKILFLVIFFFLALVVVLGVDLLGYFWLNAVREEGNMEIKI